MISEYDNYCMICGRPKQHTHHLIFGRGLRDLADKDELTIPVCLNCHELIHHDGIAGYFSKVIGQQAWEFKFLKENEDKTEDDARLYFMARYGRSWL